MTKLSKVRVQLLNPLTGEAVEDVDVLTTAECVSFSDGDTLENKMGSINNITIDELNGIIDPIINKKIRTSSRER